MFEIMVMRFVEHRGYGVWYQREAWNRVQHWSIDSAPRLFIYLDEKYPNTKN